MSDDMRDLSALAALGALEPDDARRLTDASAHDADVARELELDRAAIEQLALIADPGIAPPDLADQLVASATAPQQPSAHDDPAHAPAVTRPRRRLRRWAPAFGGGLAAAVAAVAVTLIATRGPAPEQPAVQASIVAADAQRPVSGTVALYRPTAPGGHIVVDLASLPPAPSGHHYEIWVLKKNATAMEPVGTIAPDATTPVHLDLPLPSGGTYGALDISIEENDGPPEHSGQSVAGATFGA